MSTQEQDGQAKKELDAFEAKLLAELDSDDGSDADNELPPDDSDGDGDGDGEGSADKGQQADAQGDKPAASGKATESEGQGAQGDKPGAAAEDQQDDDKAGSRSALRAARRAERLARQRAEQLERELAELRAKNGATDKDDAGDDTDDDVLLQDLEQDMPTVAAKFKRLKTQLEEAQARLKDVPKAQAEDEPAFVPESLPKELQAVVDEIDDLSDWQHDPRLQTQWELAKRVDGLLTAHPKWKDKPVAERLTEVVRRVKDELGSASSAPAPTQAPARRKPVVIDDDDAPETLSGVRGGTSPRNTEPDYSRMSDDQIMASL